MAEFKEGQKEALKPHQQAVLDEAHVPLFPEDGAESGLHVADGRLLEIYNGDAWKIGAELAPSHARASSLLLRATLNPDGVTEVAYEPQHVWSAQYPTQGAETEVLTMGADHTWHKILPDGTTLMLPDGTSKRLDAKHPKYQAEMMQQMVEYGTDVAEGYADFRRVSIVKAHEVEKDLEAWGLVAPPVSVVPNTYTRSDISEQPFVNMIALEKMPNILEFGCMSEQLHVQMKSVEAGMYALNKYQEVQALFGLLTASSPIRDGSFETTLSQHYNENPNPEYSNPLPDHDLLMSEAYEDVVPYDWRELSRQLGSPSSGAWVEAAPNTLEEFLARANKKLVSGEVISSVRQQGWRTDRIRLDKGTLEVCNLGRAGGNMHKLLATQEVVAKFLVALQEYYDSPRDTEEVGLLFDGPDSQDRRQHQVEVGHLNNIAMTLWGKDTDLQTTTGKTMSPQHLLDKIAVFTNAYSPEPISNEAMRELHATLEAPSKEAYDGLGASAVFEDFYLPGSRMTGTDAMRIAHEVEPELSTNELLYVLAQARRAHVTELYEKEVTT